MTEALRVVADERGTVQEAHRRETVALRQIQAALAEADGAICRALAALGVQGETGVAA
jgi:hypothetical protein